MLSRHDDPIIAIATAQGRGSVGVVRISGKGLAPFVKQLLGFELRAREATYVAFKDAQGEPIDQGLALYFPAPHSFTGEDVLELQGHGGQVVLQLVVARCLEVALAPTVTSGQPCLARLRLAKAGEFTERAFLNDKIDLAQAEAIADLIDASTEAAARGATQSMSGAFSREIHALRDALIKLRMLVEATLDFPEEEVDFLQRDDAQGQLNHLETALEHIFQKATQGALLRDGIKVVIAGQPNAGKSSLLNALAGAELAIVTPVPGTTRDKVQQTIQIEGVPIQVIDTAGLRQSSDVVEQIGIARAWEAITDADVVLFLHDLTRLSVTEYEEIDAEIAQTIARALPDSVPVIDVWNKSDAVQASVDSGLALSAKTGAGLNALRQALLQAAGWKAPAGGVFLARERHLEALKAVHLHLTNAKEHLSAFSQPLELLAEELRLAQNALNEITGEFTSDDLLGVIFSRFCIGK